MTQVVAGVIDSIRTKEVNTKFGAKAVYHATIGGQEVNLGFKHPYSQGETVSLSVEHKFGSLQLIGDAPAGSVSTPATELVAPAPSPAQGKSLFPVELNSTGTSICRQSSLKAACETMSLLERQGDLSGCNGEQLIARTIKLAYEFTDFVTGQREVKAAKVMEEANA